MSLFKKNKKFFSWLLLLVLILAGLWYFFKVDRHFLTYRPDLATDQVWGITYSKLYAQELGLDWRQAYLAMLDDLQIKNIRLPVYWSDIEPIEGKMDYANYDWMISEGQKRGVKFIVVVGRRQPRWPECHTPQWATTLSEQTIRDRELSMITATVKHFQTSTAITSWQAENEHFVDWFGICPKGDKEYLKNVVARIRQIDPQRDILLTDSGEFSTWKQVSDLSPTIGTTMYRVAWNQYLGYTYTPWPAWLYRFKAHWRQIAPEKMIIAELQAEPWPAEGRQVRDLTVTEINQSFPLKQLLTNAELARRTGFAATYFWGAEWWYVRLLQGDATYWETVKTIIKPVL